MSQLAEHVTGALSAAGLDNVSNGVQTPDYDRNGLTQGIVHIGVGNFHRAHQALVIDRLMRSGTATSWAICGVAALDSDEPLVRSLQAQDCLYTLVEKSNDGTWSSRVIGSITEVLLVKDDVEAVLAKLCDPAIRIVSLTVTEGGYNMDPETGEFVLDTPIIQSDLRGTEAPRSIFGLLTEALARRRAVEVPAFTVVSCDNIEHNGHVAKRMLTSFARARDRELADWIESNVSFPNSMVDRITPVTTAQDVEAVSAIIGMKDRCPVLCEPFFQWVVEDNFPAGRPEWESAGVQVTDDVAPYEKMKLRLLNASHQGIAYFARLMGYHYVHDAAQDPLIATFLRRYMDQEATPTLDPLPGVDLEAYKTELIERFANPEVKDTVARLAAESSDRIPKWLLPVIRERLEQGGDVTLSAAIVASWARYAEGVDEQGEPIDVVDPLKDQLMPIARRQREEPLAFVENRRIFGDLVEDERFREPYLQTLGSLHSNGAKATLQQLLKD